MSVERDLITRILTDQDLSAITEKGITSKFFLEAEHRSAFQWILDHNAQYSLVPPVDTFKKDGPAYRLSDPKDATEYYVDQLIDTYTHYLIEDGVYDVFQTWDNDDMEGSKARLFKLVATLNEEIAGARTVDLTDNIDTRLERYQAYTKNKGGLRGIPTGFDFLDDALGGWQQGQLITFAGPPKAGKSTLLMLCELAAHMGFYRPLFIGFEMSNEEQEARHDSIRAGISMKKLMDGTLSAEEWQRLERMTRRLSSMPPLVFSEDAASTLTISGVRSLMEKHQPDVTFVDGMYMMEDERGERKGSPQALTNLTRDFKQLAKNKRQPIGISTQVLEWKMDRKRGVTSTSIGYSSSFGQDSDALISVEPTDEPDVNKMKVLLARNSQGKEAYVRWDWETGKFEELEDYDEPEDDSQTKF